MDSVLGFRESTNDVAVVADDKSSGFKLVPWISWDDWTFVRDSLFSSSPDSISSALRRIVAWRSRGCVPVVIEVTASIIEIQQKDHFFNKDVITDKALHSEEMLAMLYCMAITRLVNGVVEKTRKKTEVSIAEAADAIGIPRMLIDIRHEGSHRDLPSLRLVRLASIKALDWLKIYYWEPQKLAIPFPSDRIGNLKKEIKSTLRELAFYLKADQTTQSRSSIVERKCVKHCERLCGRNKFLLITATKLQSSKPAGSRKRINKILKNFSQLYSSFSSEVVSVLLELLLQALDSTEVAELLKSSQVRHSTSSLQSVFEDWKPVVIKLSSKEPELLLALLKAILEMIETREALKYDFGVQHHMSEYKSAFHQIEQLSYLFEWLVGNLRGLKPVRTKGSAAETEGSSTELSLPKATLIEFLHKCLLVSSPGNSQLMSSALILASVAGNNSLVEKLNKLALLHSSNLDANDEISSLITSERFLSQQENYIHDEAKKLELFKLQHTKSNNLKIVDGDGENTNRWAVAKSWNPCPIGMLPRAVGFSGHLPVLDFDDDTGKGGRISESKEHWQLHQCSGKREADCAIEVIDNSIVKKMRGNGGACESDDKDDSSSEVVKGQLLIGGVWKKVREEELLAIASAVRILV